jgi:hypothetical protein
MFYLPDRRIKLFDVPHSAYEKPVPAYGPQDLRSAFAQLLAEQMGMAKGYSTEGDVLSQTVDGRDLNEIWAEFNRVLNFWNDLRNSIVSALSFRVAQPVEDVPQQTTDEFEEASEFGVPHGIRGGAFFSLAYDFRWYDLAARYTWKFLAEATASQVEAVNNMALEADNRLVFGKILKAIFNNINRVTDIRNQPYTVYPFYNNDGTVPPPWKNDVHLATHDHYLSLGAAPITGADLDAMETHLKHHGYGAQNNSTLFLLVNTAELAVIRNFRVASGSSYDFIPAAGQPPWLLPTNTGGVVFPQGQAVPTLVGGMRVAGRYGNWVVVEEDYIPAGYLFGFATGGDNQATNPVGMREHQNAALRGLRIVKGREPDYPLIDSYYQRGFGTGVRHRGAGVVGQVTAGAYTIPAAYV